MDTNEIISTKTDVIPNEDGQSLNSACGNIFEMHDSKLFCKVCFSNLSEPDTEKHLANKRHKQELRKLCILRNDWKYYKSNLNVPTDPVFTNSHIQRTMEVTTDPMIGLEYLIEFPLFSSGFEYICLLCYKKGVEDAIINHLKCDNHKKRYLMLHFPNTYKKIVRFEKCNNVRMRTTFKEALNDLASAIEKRYGRLKPRQVETQKYRSHLIYYLDLVRKGPHLVETNDFSIDDVIKKQENLLKAYIQDAMANGGIPTRLSEHARKRLLREHNSLVLIEEIKACNITKESQKRGEPQLPRTFGNPEKSDKVFGSSSKPQLSRTFGNPENSNKVYGSRDGQYSIAEKAENLGKYSRLSKIIDKKMENEFLKYKNQPESHPVYDQEWERFWKKRYADLKLEGKDPSQYDFTPEWKVYWDKRFLELHEAKIESKKNVWREKFGLGHVKPVKIGSSREVVLIDDDVPESPVKNSPSHPKNLLSKDKDVLSSRRDSPSRRRDSPTRRRDSPSRRRDSPSRRRDSPTRRRDSPTRRRDSPSRRRYSPSRRRDSPSRRRYSPSNRRYSPSRRRDSRSPLHRRDRDSKSPVRGESRRKRSRSRDNSSEVNSKRFRENKDAEVEEVNFIAVLRLLTAVEEHLGSLGPKVIDLLSQGLVLEGNEVNSSGKLLDIDDNLVLLETTKEKLKGQIQAGLVKKNQQNVFMNIIRKVENLIQVSKQKKKQSGADPKKKLLVVPGVGLVDKEKISQEIVETLVSQGKKDITQEELDQMIQVFARKKHKEQMTEDSKATSTKSELNQTVAYNHLTTPGLMNKSKNVHDAIVINSDDDYSFKDMVQNICQKVSDKQKNSEMDKNTKNKNQNKSFAETGNTDNRNYNANAKINIITGIPVSTITINEFNSRNAFDKDYEMTRGHWTENGGGTNVQKNTLNISSPPKSLMNFSSSYQYNTDTTSNKAPARGPSGTLPNNPFGLSSNFTKPNPSFSSSLVGGTTYKGVSYPFLSNRLSTLTEPDRNNSGGWGGPRNFESQMGSLRGETNEVRGRIGNPKSDNSGQYGFKQRELNSTSTRDVPNFERPHGYVKTKGSRFDGRK
ncbi:uncharacterized protein CG7065-like isoform X2 [Harmonia axyridis]|uniref:uncharacterized protein CG7065-like isoform X2 n=1 Tax=Harmonia axyridis TaxID=115357 RepID=UPI001E276732|nr:uncharacterized protein CG7065-like isoform X2 [Harmonia axyridis]